MPASFLEKQANLAALSDSPVNSFPSHRGFRAACLVKTRFSRNRKSPYPPPGRSDAPTIAARTAADAERPHAGPPRPSEAGLAVIAFRETMGYTLARFECGVSTYHNDPRPLMSVPIELAGLPFTQVVYVPLTCIRRTGFPSHL